MDNINEATKRVQKLSHRIRIAFLLYNLFEYSKKFERKTAFKYCTKNDAFIIVLLRYISRGINLKLAHKKENLIKCISPLRRKLLSADAARVRNLSVKDKSRAQDDLIWAIVVAHYKVLPSFFFFLSPPPFPFFLFFLFLFYRYIFNRIIIFPQKNFSISLIS